MPEICSCCGQTIRATKPTKPTKRFAIASGDTSQMTDAELFAYYKRTAPLEDLRFLRNNVHTSTNLRAACDVLEAAALNTSVSPAAFKAQYLRLQAQWRQDRNRADVAEHLRNGDRYEGGYWIAPDGAVDQMPAYLGEAGEKWQVA